MTASISDVHDRQPAGELGCAACGARLAHDQRYCIQCGERRGPLPSHVAEAIAAVFEHGLGPARPPVARTSASAPSASSTPGPESRARISWFPTPRVAAMAVLGMLAFGVAVGSAVGGGVASLASAPLLILAQQSQPSAQSGAATAADSSGDAGGSGSSGTATVQTVTVTSSGAQPQSPTPASSTTGSGSNTGPGGNGGATNALGLPPIKHVFLIVLSNRGYTQTFEPGSTDTYLSKTLPAQGEVLPQYYAVTAGPLANEIALISGQGPTLQTGANCPVFTNLVPGSVGQHGQALGAGCVYPPGVQTLADQLSSAGLHWKAYIQGLPTGAPNGCRHPKIGAPDAQPPTLDHPYATWRNPFVYFQSLTAGSTCTKNEVELSQLGLDLQAAKTTPSFSYIVADPCNDGGDSQCGPAPSSIPPAGSTTTTATSTTTTTGTTEPAGLAAADNFLKSVLPEIENSAAYKADGLIAITFDQAPQSGQYADPSSCCSNPRFPNLPSAGVGQTTTTTPGTATDPATGGQTPTTTTTTTETTAVPTTSATSTVSSSTTAAAGTTTPATGTTTPATGTTTPATGTTTSTTSPASTPPSTGTGESNPTGGGGQVGMLLLSRYVKPRTVNVTAYFNHFSLLKTVEAIFGLKYLGYAGVLEVPPFDSSVFTSAP